MHTALMILWLLFTAGGAILMLVGLVGKSVWALSLVIPCFVLGFLCRVFGEILERLMDLQDRIGKVEYALRKD